MSKVILSREINTPELQETQDELTTELFDLKEKYREVVELLRDANEEIRRSRKKTYPGMGKHSVSGMFSLPAAMQKGQLTQFTYFPYCISNAKVLNNQRVWQ